MSVRKPAASTQVKALTAQVAELEKKLAYEVSNKDRYYKEAQDVKNEVEQVHALLDVLPGSAPRKTSSENSWEQKDITAMTRLASYLALRA